MPKDLFSSQSPAYARFRPSYPVELIEYILGFVRQRKTAWDCATGNGQAAVLLSAYFERVFATDLSEKQLLLATAKENITYLLCPAEQTDFAANSFDLITIAQGYHWFQFNNFEKEARRVARPGAIIAAWGYNLPVCGNEKIDGLITHFYTRVVGAYWDAERKYVEENYQTIPFNFDLLPSKSFFIDVNWSVKETEGYLQSWSSVQHFIKANGYNPVDALAAELLRAWPEAHSTMRFRFPVFLKIGRIK